MVSGFEVHNPTTSSLINSGKRSLQRSFLLHCCAKWTLEEVGGSIGRVEVSRVFSVLSQPQLTGSPDKTRNGKTKKSEPDSIFWRKEKRTMSCGEDSAVGLVVSGGADGAGVSADCGESSLPRTLSHSSTVRRLLFRRLHGQKDTPEERKGLRLLSSSFSYVFVKKN